MNGQGKSRSFGGDFKLRMDPFGNGIAQWVHVTIRSVPELESNHCLFVYLYLYLNSISITLHPSPSPSLSTHLHLYKGVFMYMYAWLHENIHI